MKAKHILPKQQNKIITKIENDVKYAFFKKIFFLTYSKDVIQCSNGFTFRRMADPFPLLPFDSLNGLELIGAL